MGYPYCNQCDQPQAPLALLEQLTKEEQRQFLFGLIEHIEHDELLQLIKDLDEHVSDWRFTMALAKHFDQLKKAYYQETKKDAIAKACRPRVS